MCLVVSALAFMAERGWQQTLAFAVFGVLVVAKETVEDYSSAAKQAVKAADELASKSEQLKSLDTKVNQLTDRMLRYETRR